MISASPLSEPSHSAVTPVIPEPSPEIDVASTLPNEPVDVKLPDTFPVVVKNLKYQQKLYLFELLFLKYLLK